MREMPLTAVALIVFLFFLGGLTFTPACNGVDPPPPACEQERLTWPECESTGGEWVPHEEICECECPEGEVFMEDKGCEVVPPPPPEKDCSTPLPERECIEYIRKDRVADILWEIRAWDNILINDGVRNPRKAKAECGDSVLPYNGYKTWEEIDAVSAEAYETKVRLTGFDGESGFKANLQKPHRSCDPEKWVQVYGPCFKVWSDKAKQLTAEPDGQVTRLDGIYVKCEDMQ